MSVHIIAEAGSNYNGSVELAYKLNSIAKNAGADSVKYQIIYPEGLYRPGNYVYGHYDIKNVWKIRQDGILTDGEWEAVHEDALSKGILFSSSVFDIKGLDLLCKIDPPYLKTASSDLNNLRFLREVASRGKRMVVSTGMASLGDIEKTVSALYKEGIQNEQLVLLHCVSAYPSELENTNLIFLNTLRNAFGTAVGFSDHTLGREAACVAVALGATWIEKHFTIDHTLDGFDHKHAMEEEDFTLYVKAIRAVEASLIPKVQKIGDAEAYTRTRARRGLYASKKLNVGHILTNDDILIVRPETSIAADEIDNIVGKVLKQEMDAFEPISLDFIESNDK